jgi:hypothetical protein
MFARPDEDGDHQLLVIDSIWQKTQLSWRDDIARHFERAHWTPLLTESRTYLVALGECLETMNAAERDTEF